jgi:hypothetical protein
MHTSGIELLKERHGSLKFILHDSGIVFFPAAQQHRDIKTAGLSYEDDYLGNAVAGTITPQRVDIRFHRAYSDERIRALWSRVVKVPEIAAVSLGQLYYQGRAIG